MKKTFLILVSLLIAVSAFSQTYWSLTGNAGTTTSNFVGTTNNNPLILRANNDWAGFTGYPDKNNVSFGYKSLTNAMGTGTANAAFGAQALQWNSVASGNVAIGAWALEWCTAGDNNVAVGTGAMNSSLSVGNCNVAVGQKALFNNRNSENTAVGSDAAFSNTDGTGLTAVGYKALCSNTNGEFNTAIGYQALLLNTTGFWNAALGSGSLQSNSTGYRNTAGGNSAMWFNTTGYENAAFGEQALGGSIDGHYNTAVGCRALWSVRFDPVLGDIGYGHGNNNTAVGYESLREITTGSSNVGVGMHALRVNSAGSNNVAMGNYALTSNTTGGGNIAIGNQALYSNVDGTDNVAIGDGALRSSTFTEGNVAVGKSALMSNTEGGENTAVGYQALSSNTRGGANTAVGLDALRNNTTGYLNCAYGAAALAANTEGGGNVAVGFLALYGNTTGYNNIAIGSETDIYCDDGGGNTVIGHWAKAGCYNSTAIGNMAYATADNQVMIGNNYVTSIRGYVPWTTISDGRVKKNIQSDVPGLDFIKLLQPVTYTMDLEAADQIQRAGIPQRNENDSLPFALLSAQMKAKAKEKEKATRSERKQTGFVAQDVEKAAKSIGYDFSGVDADESGEGLYGLRYSEFIVPLVKAVQELSAENEAKDSMIASMQQRIDQWEEINDAATVQELKRQVEELTGLVNRLLEKENNPFPDAGTARVPGASLEQNFPNPFNHSTVINYTLPQEVRSGKIVITDLSGRVFKQLSVSGPGTGSITIEGGSLPAGAYYYSLYADNTLVDTKKMVLTK